MFEVKVNSFSLSKLFSQGLFVIIHTFVKTRFYFLLGIRIAAVFYLIIIWKNILIEQVYFPLTLKNLLDYRIGKRLEKLLYRTKQNRGHNVHLTKEVVMYILKS